MIEDYLGMLGPWDANLLVQSPCSRLAQAAGPFDSLMNLPSR